MKKKNIIMSAVIATALVASVGTSASAMAVKEIKQETHPSIVKIEKPVIKQGKLVYETGSKYWAYETIVHPVTKEQMIKLVQKTMPGKFFLIAKDGKFELQPADVYRALNISPTSTMVQKPEEIQKKFAQNLVEVRGTMTDYLYNAKLDPQGKYKAEYLKLKHK